MLAMPPLRALELGQSLSNLRGVLPAALQADNGLQLPRDEQFEKRDVVPGLGKKLSR